VAAANQTINSVAITSIATDTGPSVTDFYTSDQTLILSGTAVISGVGNPAVVGVWAVNGASSYYLGNAVIQPNGSWAFSTASAPVHKGTFTLKAFAYTSPALPSGAPLNDTSATKPLIIDTSAPLNYVPHAQVDLGPSPLIFGSYHGNRITVGDNASDQLTMKFSVANGALSVSGTMKGVTVSGSGTTTLTVVGNEHDINTYINNNLTYTTKAATANDSLTIQTTDQAGNVSIANSVAIYCFMAGTMIRTPDGEAAVETLQRGDLVITADGRSLPVSWLGRQTVSTIFGDKLRVLPIRIKAGALAENVPCRDLLLSPDHAILIDGVLTQAGALVNDASILRESAVPTIFTYYHVEVEDHALILAENTPAETFVDNVDRMSFDNWNEHLALYPEGKSISELPYPRAKGRRQVPVHLRVKLAERAELIGAAVVAVA